MSNDNVFDVKSPESEMFAKDITDTLTSFLREKANSMLQIAIEKEASEIIARYSEVRLSDNKRRVVLNGYLPERTIQTGIGGISVKVPRVRDRNLEANDKITFNNSLIPKYMRRTATLDVMLPLLYLKGVSTNEFSTVLEPILGSNAKSISPGVISGLKKIWYNEFEEWQKSSLSDKKFAYFWVDGVYLKARMETDKNCLLVVVGVNECGKKEVVGFLDGFRESKDSWKELLISFKKRGLSQSPHLAIGDGALGFWGAISEVFPNTKHQRCWVHKTANVLDKMPKSTQTDAKQMLHNIYLSDTKKDAFTAFNKFVNKYSDKYSKATNCLIKDKEELMQFYSFPKQHWSHIRTTNPIESTFATVKHRTRQSRGAFSRETIIGSTFKLLQEAQKRWKKLYGYKFLSDVFDLVEFTDGIKTNSNAEKENLKNTA